MADRGVIRVTVVGATDVGRVREHNEDKLLVADLTAGESAESGQSISGTLGARGLLLAVADGMGGAASGELASQMAVDTLHQAFEAKKVTEGVTPKVEIPGILCGCIKAANEQIWQKSQAESKHRGMGTTITAAFALGDSLSLAQVGDSRAYLMRKGKLVQVTKDQSLISQLVEDGTLTEEEAERLGGRNIILQALGVEADVTVESKSLEVLAGDIVVLCSDGLSTMVKDEEIERTIADADDVRVACARLVTMANDGGGKDNVTVILVRYEGPGLREPMRPLEAEKRSGEEPPAATTFAAPEIPRMRRSYLKAALAGGAGFLALVLALVFLLGASGEVTFVFPAAGAAGRLVPESGGEETTLSLGNATALTVSVSPGKYSLFAELDHHEPLEQIIVIGRGASTLEVPLVAKPGTLELRPGTPRVTVRIERVERQTWEGPYEHEVSLVSEPQEYEAAAGRLTLTVSREGFRTQTLEVLLPPEGRESVILPELRALTGTLVLPCPVVGAEVLIVDDYGDTIYEGRVPVGGSLRADVRVGTHHLEIRHPRYETHKSQITIREEVETGFDYVKLLPKKGSVLVKGPPGKWVTVGDRQEPIPPTGELLIEDLTPGTYDVEIDRGAGVKQSKSVVVQAADTASVEFDQ